MTYNCRSNGRHMRTVVQRCILHTQMHQREQGQRCSPRAYVATYAATDALSVRQSRQCSAKNYGLQASRMGWRQTAATSSHYAVCTNMAFLAAAIETRGAYGICGIYAIGSRYLQWVSANDAGDNGAAAAAAAAAAKTDAAATTANAAATAATTAAAATTADAATATTADAATAAAATAAAVGYGTTRGAAPEWTCTRDTQPNFHYVKNGSYAMHI